MFFCLSRTVSVNYGLPGPTSESCLPFSLLEIYTGVGLKESMAGAGRGTDACRLELGSFDLGGQNSTMVIARLGRLQYPSVPVSPSPTGMSTHTFFVSAAVLECSLYGASVTM